MVTESRVFGEQETWGVGVVPIITHRGKPSPPEAKALQNLRSTDRYIIACSRPHGYLRFVSTSNKSRVKRKGQLNTGPGAKSLFVGAPSPRVPVSRFSRQPGDWKECFSSTEILPIKDLSKAQPEPQRGQDVGGVKKIGFTSPEEGKSRGTHNAREGPERDRAPGSRLPPEVIPVGGEAVDAPKPVPNVVWNLGSFICWARSGHACPTGSHGSSSALRRNAHHAPGGRRQITQLPASHFRRLPADRGRRGLRSHRRLQNFPGARPPPQPGMERRPAPASLVGFHLQLPPGFRLAHPLTVQVFSEWSLHWFGRRTLGMGPPSLWGWGRGTQLGMRSFEEWASPRVSMKS